MDEVKMPPGVEGYHPFLAIRYKASPHIVASIPAEEFNPEIHELARLHTAANAAARFQGPSYNEAISTAPPVPEETQPPGTRIGGKE